jgi:hypothetical protein
MPAQVTMPYVVPKAGYVGGYRVGHDVHGIANSGLGRSLLGAVNAYSGSTGPYLLELRDGASFDKRKTRPLSSFIRGQAHHRSQKDGRRIAVIRFMASHFSVTLMWRLRG